MLELLDERGATAHAWGAIVQLAEARWNTRHATELTPFTETSNATTLSRGVGIQVEVSDRV